MTAQFRFYAIMEEASDKKTSVYKLKWIQPVGSEQYYEFPAEQQNISNHPKIHAISKVKTVLAAMKTRGAYRTFTLTLPPETAALYCDADGDIVYKDIYLQATKTPQYDIKSTKKEKEENIATLLKQIALATKREEDPEATPRKNLRKVREDFILDSFDGKNFPAKRWLQTFGKECERCKVETDEDKILILRLFLDGTAKDWFSSKVITIGLDFDTWEKAFLDSFRETGWHKDREAYSFRYIGGSLIDYALRKENLLVNVRENFPTDILISLIVTDLPITIQDKIEKTKITSMEELLTELRKLESSIQKEK
ncbi:hypothetical protein KPH14_000919 [Odynerus spinipes]|uniref:Retrotransposon gag domain-containing protein n=1 Tax=Odynerus spinipes TaxID=1348599 RepID=A0AAD9VLW6_9HYME|nr:hypothetical protein KPH14_000919 [Odynerus spinipes]